MERKDKTDNSYQRYIDDMYTMEDLKQILKGSKGQGSTDEFERSMEHLWTNLEEDSCITALEREKCRKEAIKLLAKTHRRKYSLLARKWIRFTISTAAVLLLIVGGTRLYEKQMQKQMPVLTVSTSYGEHKQILLPDGTELTLNSCATIKYPQRFIGDTRSVELTGEGCFKVKRNLSKPFIVKMKDLSITVLGTIFNVKSHPSDEVSAVEVKEGKVQVNLPDAMIRLSSGEYLVINKALGSYNKRRTEDEKFAIWRKGELRFEETSIQDVAKELERIYNCRIKFKQGQDFDNLITGIHENSDLKTILSSIEYATGIHHTYTNDSILLYKD